VGHAERREVREVREVRERRREGALGGERADVKFSYFRGA
jgi:hypothetical protein